MKKVIAGLMLIVSVASVTFGCVLSDPYSASLSLQEGLDSTGNPAIVSVTVSVEGYGYGDSGYFVLAHSTNPIVESDFTNGETDTVSHLAVTDNWEISVTPDEGDYGATNYYAIKIMDYDPDVTIISDTVSSYVQSREVDHYEISVANSVTEKTHFPVTTIPKNKEGATILSLMLSTDALITAVHADDESLAASGMLVIVSKTWGGDSTIILTLSYTAVEDIKIKIVSNGTTSLSDRISVKAKPLTDVDYFVVSVDSTVTAGTSFPVTVTGKDSAGVTIPFNLDDSALIQPILASDESLTGSDVLRVTSPKTYEGNSILLHYAYTKAEDIKIKFSYDGKVALSNTLTIMAGTLVDMDVEASPSSIISGQSSDITSCLWDIYSNRIKSIKIQFKVNKGKGRLDKEEGESDVTGKIKIKFFDDNGKPGINTINVTALQLSQDIQINVAVLVYGKNGGTIVASEDPNTQVVIPPDAVSGDVQLMIKTGDELSDETKDKVNHANDKAVDSMCEDKVRGFECKKDDGSDYGDFDDLVTIEIPYTDDDNDDVVDGTCIKVDDLKVCRLNEDTECWEKVNDGGCNEIDKERKVIKAQVGHFSTYNIGALSSSGLSEFRVYPNPINFSKSVRNTLKFGNLPQNTKIEIYDIIGRLVRSINSLDSSNVEWDGKNESGESISMGLYIYLLTDSNGNKKTGKIGVQK